ncbi:hypothetical protein FWF48_02115 [Candidatus Saccharibacteria bacterium]|nr:hypothetical protein [Candidatus Saccharibacteria bacterium]
METVQSNSTTRSVSKAVLVDDGLLITVKEARKILGKGAKNLSDEYLTTMIVAMEALAQDVVIKNVVPNLQQVCYDRDKL